MFFKFAETMSGWGTTFRNRKWLSARIRMGIVVRRWHAFTSAIGEVWKSGHKDAGSMEYY